VSLASLLLVAGLASAAAPAALFEEGSHCVAYRARKTMFLISSSEVVGKNCDVSAQVLPEVGGLYRIEVNVPLKSFQSGDVDRDQDVMKTLKADVKPEITFSSKALTAEQWRGLMQLPEFEIAGELTIGNKSFPLKMVSHFSNQDGEVDGRAMVKFEDFDIAPPSVGAGLVAKAKPDFELHFHLQGNRILGADTIRPEKPSETK
jgi:polyisoprenoid-binding protein YceI